MRVGVVPFREKKGRFQICLISSLSKPKCMTFPKGLTKKMKVGKSRLCAKCMKKLDWWARSSCVVCRCCYRHGNARMNPAFCSGAKLMMCSNHGLKRNCAAGSGTLSVMTWISSLTRNASKIYHELIELGLDQDDAALDDENYLRQKLMSDSPGARLIA